MIISLSENLEVMIGYRACVDRAGVKASSTKKRTNCVPLILVFIPYFPSILFSRLHCSRGLFWSDLVLRSITTHKNSLGGHFLSFTSITITFFFFSYSSRLFWEWALTSCTVTCWRPPIFFPPFCGVLSNWDLFCLLL